jgi:hypothetical protein
MKLGEVAFICVHYVRERSMSNLVGGVVDGVIPDADEKMAELRPR